MAEIFQYIVVFSLAIWTARLAITKGRSGWVWGAAALILGLLPWHIIGAIPVLALMFIKTPVNSTETQPVPLICARCNKSHSKDQHFCTGCGWDLNQTDTPPKVFDEDQSRVGPRIQDTDQLTVITDVPEITEYSTTNSEAGTRHESVITEEGMSEVETEAVSESAQEQPIPWGTYDVGEAPTAEAMVSRGLERFDEGKFQEAIDQFTKAIALDPNYAEAWEQRSKAYTQLGRPQQAEDDLRHWQGLDPSSSLS